MGRRLYVWLIIALLFAACGGALAQTIITEKIERKFTLNPYLGIALFPSKVTFNDLKVPKNLFEGYHPAPVVGIAAWYKYKKRVYYGGDVNFLFTSRNINASNEMSMLGLSALGKIYIFNTKKRINPYVIAGFNVSFINLNRDAQVIVTNPDSAGDFKVISNQKNYNKLDLYMAPVFGPVGGIGVEVKVSRKISAFLQASVQTSFSTNPLIQSAYPDNTSLVQYASFRGGINMKVFKRMKFEIDTQAVKIPDMIVLLTPEEIDAEKQQMLSREGNFDINIREGLRHSLQVSIQDGELNMVMDSEGGPCKSLAILYDQFGNKIATAEADANGNINFSNLEKGIYNVAFEVQPPCPQSSNLSYQINSPGAEVLSQGNEEYTPQVDSLAYNIEGFVDFKDPNLEKELQVMLVDQDNKQVKAKIMTTGNGKFSFKNLTPGNYKVVYEVPSSKVQTRIAYNVKDNQAHLIKQENFPFNEMAKSREGTRLMTGKLEMNDPTVAAYKVNLDLVDQYNRVVDHSIPNLDGSFEFIDRKSDKNDVIYELGDKKLEKELLASNGDKPAPLVRSIIYQPKIEDREQLAALLASGANAGDAKLDKNVKPINTSEMQMYRLYNRDGEITTISGFGYQVGAFRNLDNVYNLMDKLKLEGFEAYVQSVMSNDVATKFKTSTNYKLHRIIVFGSENDLVANEIKAKLIQQGYPIIVKEHFTPQNKYKADGDENPK